MDTFFINWFHGLDKGLDRMSQQECSRLFSACASHCANDAFQNLYRDLFDACDGNLDVFFTRLNEIDGIGGNVIQSGLVYEILFKSCNCDLHTKAKMNSGKLCECSRQSILCILGKLAPNGAFSVEKVKSILDGGKVCRFRIRSNT